MTESKITATDRLRHEGRWEEASLWRDEKRRQLREEGQTRAEANDASWQAMMTEFPPLDPDQGGSNADVELLEINPDNYDNQPDLVRDTLWAYESLCKKGVGAEDAPSLGAWSLLNWARQNRNRFFEVLLPKAMAAKERQAEQRESEVMEDPGIEDIQKILDDIQLGIDRQLVADVDGTIKRQVKSHMSDWESHFNLDLTPDARESWVLKMAKLVDGAIQAVTKHLETTQAG